MTLATALSYIESERAADTFLRTTGHRTVYSSPATMALVMCVLQSTYFHMSHPWPTCPTVSAPLRCKEAMFKSCSFPAEREAMVKYFD